MRRSSAPASANYESAELGARPLSEPPRFFETNPRADARALRPRRPRHLWPDFPRRCEVVFPERVGPFIVEGAGHFLQWERADVLNQALIYFLR